VAPFPYLEGVARALNASGAAHISIAANGSMVYLLSDGVSAETRLALIDRSGKLTELPVPPGNYAEPRVSPDGRQISVVSVDQAGNGSIWIYDLTGSTSMRKLTFDTADYPVWTPDSRRIIFRSLSANAILWQDAYGNSPAEELQKSRPGDPSAVSPNGQTLVFRVVGPGDPDLWMMSLAGDRTPKPLITRNGVQDQLAFSPDGRWIAYRSNESGQSLIYVDPFPPVNGVKHQLTTQVGNSPL